MQSDVLKESNQLIKTSDGTSEVCFFWSGQRVRLRLSARQLAEVWPPLAVRPAGRTPGVRMVASHAGGLAPTKRLEGSRVFVERATGSNPRPSPWQGDALPLSYTALNSVKVYTGCQM